ncbi:hypothetical protein ACVCII_01580 [Burkholderia glumae]|uniref:hypothetical protein n=1 Tax=Burkholderia glumae TaxID=337 RepID=UPI002036D0EA|nr:hypothetical protein [Burkholderia glumae]MCM2547199.1 hypothetical protein [Burkholderia glumae]
MSQIRVIAMGLLISAWLMATQPLPMLRYLAKSDAISVVQAFGTLLGPSSVMGVAYYLPAIVTLFSLGAGLAAAWLINVVLTIAQVQLGNALSATSRAVQFGTARWRR